jgi:uncharacterized protein with PIN domain
MNIVLDASAMIAFLRDEAGAEAVMNQMRQPERNMFAHALNLSKSTMISRERAKKQSQTKQSMICSHSA